MGGRARWLVAALAIIGGVATTGMTTGPAAVRGCDGARIVGVYGGEVVEGTQRGGYSALDFRVTTTGCPEEGSVRWEAVPFTADKDDFEAASGEFRWRAGEQTDQRITVRVVADSVPERNECVGVRLTGVTGKVLVEPAEAGGLIRDDDSLGRDWQHGLLGFICSE